MHQRPSFTPATVSTLLLAFALSSTALAQSPTDTSKSNSRSTFEWHLVAEHLYQTLKTTSAVFTPQFQRPLFSYAQTSDNPLIHGAAYVKVEGRYTPIPGFWTHAELVAEHRGISYGIYPTREMIVFPRILFGVDTSATILGVPLWTRIRVGHFNDLRLQEGLTIYNIDVQGADVAIGYKSLSFRVHHIGDLQNGYGLNIGDLHNYLIELKGVDLGEGMTLTSSAMFQTTDINPEAWSIAGRINYADIDFYGSVGRKNNNRYFSDNWASLGGVRTAIKTEDVELAGSLEYRFYTAGYNFRRVKYGYPLHRGYPGSMSVGQFLYPLDRIDRPLNVWALHTEYQGADVESGSAYANGRARLFHDLWIHGMGELVAIASSSSFYGGVVYPLYDIGLAWEPLPNSFLRVSLGNRSMTLNKNYPTLHAMRGPAVNMTIRVTY